MNRRNVLVAWFILIGWHAASTDILAREAATARPAVQQPRAVRVQSGTLDIAVLSRASGNGTTDDTASVQRALSRCSELGLTCIIPRNTTYLITGELFLWGRGSLVGTDATSILKIRTGSKLRVLNIGIGSTNPDDAYQKKPAWSGTIRGVTFQTDDTGPASPSTARMIFFWRTNGGTIVSNTFLFGDGSTYSATSSGNNNNIVRGCAGENPTPLDGACVRRNLTITGNTVTASQDNLGGEGFGLNLFDGVEIANNTVSGVGDDMIGIHFSDNVNIHDNTLAGVDGRLFVAQSRNVTVFRNHISRMASTANGTWYAGSALIYVGHENDATNVQPAPTNVIVRDNTVVLPNGSIESGPAFYIRGPRRVVIERNTLQNDASGGSTQGMQITSFPYSSGTWTDPTGLDSGNVGRVHSVIVQGNDLTVGSQHRSILMTGACATNYLGNASNPGVVIRGNTASAYQFICGPTQSGNVTIP